MYWSPPWKFVCALWGNTASKTNKQIIQAQKADIFSFAFLSSWKILQSLASPRKEHSTFDWKVKGLFYWHSYFKVLWHLTFIIYITYMGEHWLFVVPSLITRLRQLRFETTRWCQHCLQLSPINRRCLHQSRLIEKSTKISFWACLAIDMKKTTPIELVHFSPAKVQFWCPGKFCK